MQPKVDVENRTDTISKKKNNKNNNNKDDNNTEEETLGGKGLGYWKVCVYQNMTQYWF